MLQDTKTSLMPVHKERVRFIQLIKHLTFKAFCEKYELEPKTDYVFLELHIMKEFQRKKDIHNVILLDKVGFLEFVNFNHNIIIKLLLHLEK